MTDDIHTDDLEPGKYNEYENVYDFIEFKMHSLVEQAWQQGREDIAMVLSDALDKYILGAIDIVFISGWPHMYDVNRNVAEDIEN